MTRSRSIFARLALASMMALVGSSLGACGGGTDSPEATSDDELRVEALPLGTYVLEGKPSASRYLARLTLLSNDKYEADIVVEGDSPRFSRGSYKLFAARANNPDSPVRTDKPWIALYAESGPGPNFEYDRLPDGGLAMFAAARQQTFSMKKDPNWRPAATVTKTISCTGTRASAKLVLDAAQNRGGTLELKGKRGERTPTATVPVLLTPASETGSRDWVRYEGSKGDQDFSFGMKKDDFDRGTGEVEVSANWAEGGQQFGVAFDRCSF